MDRDDLLQQFWALAQRYAKIGDLDVIMGKGWSESLAPPAWSFGGTPEESDALLALVLAGHKTATSGLLQEYEEDNESLPRKGDLSIILDAEGTPQALIRETEVQVVPFGQITSSQAEAEGEGDLETWRNLHRTFWERQGYLIDDDTRVVWERFTVVYHL